MGQSTNAIIAFGFDLGEELPERLEDLLSQHDDADEMLAVDYLIELPDTLNIVVFCRALV